MCRFRASVEEAEFRPPPKNPGQEVLCGLLKILKLVTSASGHFLIPTNFSLIF